MADCEEIRDRLFPRQNETTYTPPEERPLGAYIDFVMFWVNFAAICAGLFLFVITKFVIIPRKSPYWRYLEVRPLAAIGLVHLGVILALICGSVSSFVPFNTFPCWLSDSVILVPAMVTLPPAIRFFTFYRQYQITKAAKSATALAVQQIRQRKPSFGTNSMSEADDSHTDFDNSIPIKHILLGFFLPHRLQIDMEKQNAIVHAQGDDAEAVNKQQQHQDVSSDYENLLSMVRVLRSLSGQRGILVVLIFCMIPYMIAFAALVAGSEFARNGCNTCVLKDQPALQGVLYVGAAIPCVVCVASFWLVRKAPDRLYVVLEVRTAFVFFGIPTVIFLILSGATFARHDFNFRFIYQMFLLFFALIQSVCLSVWVLYKHYGHVRKQAEQVVYNNDIAEFEACLNDPAMHQAFMDHLVAEHSVESLRFHDEIVKWEHEYHDVGVRTAQLRARKIVTLFVGDDAVFSVNLPGDTIRILRASVGLTLTKSTSTHWKGFKSPSFKFSNAAAMQGANANDNEVRDVDKHFFDEADHQIRELMRLDGFSRFQKTRRYRELKKLGYSSRGKGSIVLAMEPGSSNVVVPIAPSPKVSKKDVLSEEA